MKDSKKDKSILLTTAQEHLAEVSNNMMKWDMSQLTMEKSAFESLNLSDEVLNLSRKGNELVGSLLECCQALLKHPGPVEQKKVTAVMLELLHTFEEINDASARINEFSHQIEAEASVQKDIEEQIKGSLMEVSVSVDTALACAEFHISDF